MRTASAVLYASSQGRYSDSPRAIHEELLRRDAPLEHIWLLCAGAGPVPADVTTVRPGDAECLRHFERADYIVSNDVLGVPFEKAPGTTYLQTWHGTPLKRIAFDVRRPSFPGSRRHYGRDLPRDVARWDFLLSPNRFSTDILRRAFRYDGQVLETGYPRNDLLLAPGRDAIRQRVRQELGIEDGVRAVLYAPTWRDGDPFDLALDPEELERALGDGHVLLLRAHGVVAHTVGSRAAPGMRDVTHHQDLRELYLAADVLVTDYSSVMFDFAVTRKPMLFFTYDLARYRDALRGFYFDFEAEAPGPLLTSTSDVIGALSQLDEVTADHAEAYDRFHARFCHLDDGRASQRVVDAVFGSVATGSQGLHGRFGGSYLRPRT